MGLRPFVPSPVKKRVALRRIKGSTEIEDLQDALEQFIADLNTQMAESYLHGIPIGVYFAFDPTLFPDGYSLGDKFVPADGRAINDRRSPLHGKNVKTIADQLGASGLSWFVRVRD